MIYITQLIFVKPGKEEVFHEFEDHAIPILSKYNGRVDYRIRPKDDSFIDFEGEKPYEIHIVSFDSEADFQAFMQDESRKEFLHLKEESVQSILLVKGEKM